MQIMIVKLINKLLLTVAVLSLSAHAFALEPNEAVKVTPLLRTATTWDGQAIVYPMGKAEVTAMRVEILPGAEIGWHKHSVPSFAVMLEGSLEVRLKDGRVKKLEAGDVLVEVVNTSHTGRNVGTVPVRLVVFYTGIKGQAHTAPALYAP